MKARALHRRYGRAAAKAGWIGGRRPSHAEIWANGKPLAIAKVGRGYVVSVMGNPVVRGPEGLTFKGRVGDVTGLEPEKFKTKDDARHVAHRIWRYMFDLGDFVTTYVEGY